MRDLRRRAGDKIPPPIGYFFRGGLVRRRRRAGGLPNERQIRFARTFYFPFRTLFAARAECFCGQYCSPARNPRSRVSRRFIGGCQNRMGKSGGNFLSLKKSNNFSKDSFVCGRAKLLLCRRAKNRRAKKPRGAGFRQYSEYEDKMPVIFRKFQLFQSIHGGFWFSAPL